MGEWQTVTLGSLGAAFATGPFGSSVSAKNFRTSGTPMLRGSNLSEEVGVRLNEADLVYVDDELAAKFSRCIATTNDLVFTCWGTVGQIGIIAGSSSYASYFISNKQMKMTPDESKASPLFLYYFLSQPTMLSLVKGQAIGSSVPGFNLGQLKDLPVQLPDLMEQRAIAEVLGALDDKIAANDRIASLTKEFLAAEFARMGVDSIDAASNSSLEDMIELNPKVQTPAGSEPAYLEMKNLPDQAMTVTDWGYRSARGGARFQNGDTLLARITPCLENGKVGYVDFLGEDEVGIGSTEFIVLRPRSEIPAVLPYFLASSPRFRDFAIKHMIGTSGRQRLAAADLAEYPLHRPEATEFERFESLSSGLMARVKAAVDESRKLSTTRDSLLPLLMSGKVRVRDAEKVVEEVV